MSLSYKVTGDTAAIRGLAEWLDPTLAGPVESGYQEFNGIALSSDGIWFGASGDGYRQVGFKLSEAAAPVAPYVRDSAEVFRAYAGQLERMQEDFFELADRLRGKGVGVYGFSILLPTTTLKSKPKDDAEQDDIDAWDTYGTRVAAYKQACVDVLTRWDELEAWLIEHMAPLAERMEELQTLSTVFDTLVDKNEDVASVILDGLDAYGKEHLAGLLENSESMQQTADATRDGLRSGDPSKKAAAIEADLKGQKLEMKLLNEAISHSTKVGRVIPGIGLVFDAASTVIELAQGGSPTSIGIEIVGGAAGGLGGGLLIGSLALPPVAIAVAVGGIAAAAGGAARWAYEEWVPLDEREKNDAELFEVHTNGEPTPTGIYGTTNPYYLPPTTPYSTSYD